MSIGNILQRQFSRHELVYSGTGHLTHFKLRFRCIRGSGSGTGHLEFVFETALWGVLDLTYNADSQDRYHAPSKLNVLFPVPNFNKVFVKESGSYDHFYH